jgi:hypothetical protein
VKGKALLLGALLVGAAIGASSDATASAPALSLTTTPTIQRLETTVVDTLDPKAQKREPALRFGTAIFNVVVANTGDVELDSVSVVDPASPTCNRTIGVLATGATVSYVCHASNVGRNFTNRMTARGSTQDGIRTLAAATAAVKVRKPHVKGRGKSSIPTIPTTPPTASGGLAFTG